MSKGKPLAAPPAPPADDADAAADPAILLAEEHLRVLAELRACGMEMARTLAERAALDLHSAKALIAHTESEDKYGLSPRYPVPMQDPASTFAKISRAIRLTLALEAKTAERLRALRAGVIQERETRRAEKAKGAEPATEDRHAVAKKKVHDIVLQAINAEDTDDAEESFGVWEALEERLELDDAYAKLEDRPLREVVEQLCADLCIEVDWSRWTGEGWAPIAFPFRSKFSPFKTPSRTTILSPPPIGGWGPGP
jgi:hypothetical protein